MTIFVTSCCQRILPEIYIAVIIAKNNLSPGGMDFAQI
jgi:hypothetical protein